MGASKPGRALSAPFWKNRTYLCADGMPEIGVQTIIDNVSPCDQKRTSPASEVRRVQASELTTTPPGAS